MKDGYPSVMDLGCGYKIGATEVAKTDILQLAMKPQC